MVTRVLNFPSTKYLADDPAECNGMERVTSKDNHHDDKAADAAPV